MNISRFISLFNRLVVVLRSYIAGMRDQLREYKAKAEHGEHAHYHGDKLCTSDHGEWGATHPKMAPILIEALNIWPRLTQMLFEYFRSQP